MTISQEEVVADIAGRTPNGWYGLAVGKGWYPLVFEAHEAIKTLFPDYEVHQIKEKFGGLRYYCSVDGIPEVRAIISVAEQKAAATCEDCGAPGKARRTGWIVTLCDECSSK